MNDSQNQSYSLLSQEEIDVLVSFLLEKKNTINSDVLSQQSIDKLIYLISHDRHGILMDLFEPFSELDSDFLGTLHFRSTAKEVCELQYTLDSDTGFIKLTALNKTTGKTLSITPKLIEDGDVEDWGATISPSLFNRIARSLQLKYSVETHDAVCERFASVLYGDASHSIPAIHMPTNEHLIETLL